MKYIFFLIVFFNLMHSASTSFSDSKNLLEKIKQVIQDEEAIAKAYEAYLINEKSIISDILSLKNNDYLGSTFEVTFSGDNENLFYDYSFVSGKAHSLEYRLKDSLLTTANIKKLYESDTYRKKTFYYNGQIKIILDSNLSKNIYYLSSAQSSPLLECSDSSSKRYCLKNDHIYLYEDDSFPKDMDKLMMYYHIDNFEEGPIIIRDDLSLHDRDEFKYLTPGAKIYDINGQKYLKTIDSLQKVQ